MPFPVAPFVLPHDILTEQDRALMRQWRLSLGSEGMGALLVRLWSQEVAWSLWQLVEMRQKNPALEFRVECVMFADGPRKSEVVQMKVFLAHGEPSQEMLDVLEDINACFDRVQEDLALAFERPVETVGGVVVAVLLERGVDEQAVEDFYNRLNPTPFREWLAQVKSLGWDQRWPSQESPGSDVSKSRL